MSTPILEDLNRFIDFINSGDTDIGKEIVSESAIFHIPFGSGPLKGLDGYLQILGMMRGAFPDIQWTLQETVCEGDTVVARFETKGTHNGFFMGVPPTGKPIVEERGLPDLFGVMIQIAALPIGLPPS
ncbi:hypothetical protein CFE70_004106 [Pyrenophora teres f. teres 0-1]